VVVTANIGELLLPSTSHRPLYPVAHGVTAATSFLLQIRREEILRWSTQGALLMANVRSSSVNPGMLLPLSAGSYSGVWWWW
jgi:hypothetical protein